MLLTFQSLNLLEDEEQPPVPDIVPPSIKHRHGAGEIVFVRKRQSGGMNDVYQVMYAAGHLDEYELAALLHMDAL